MSRKICISVIGSGDLDGPLSGEISRIARGVGKEIALRGAVLVCGGLGGIMAEAAKGAKEEGGLTVGIIPGENPDSANPYIDISLPTGMGFARNVLVAYSGDAVIAISGRFGTLSEISFALIKKKPVIGIDTWDLCRLALGSGSDKVITEQQHSAADAYGSSVIKCSNAREAVEKAFTLIRRQAVLQNCDL